MWLADNPGVRHIVTICALSLLLLGGLCRSTAATNDVPRNVTLEVTVIRFKPESKEQVLQDFHISGDSAAIVEALQIGRAHV